MGDGVAIGLGVTVGAALTLAGAVGGTVGVMGVDPQLAATSANVAKIRSLIRAISTLRRKRLYGDLDHRAAVARPNRPFCL